MTPSREELARLLALADELAQETKKLGGQTADGLARIGKKTSQNSTLIYGLIASLVLDLVLTILLALGFVQIGRTQDGISAVTARLDNAQSEQRQKGLCPLYTMFYLATDTPEERDVARDRSQDPEQFNRSVDVIHKGYKDLECAEFKGDAPGLPK